MFGFGIGVWDRGFGQEGYAVQSLVFGAGDGGVVWVSDGDAVWFEVDVESILE